MRGLSLLCLCVLAFQVGAADGRLRGSGGLLSVEGAAGGGLVPWAVIAGHGERGEWDLVAATSVVDTGDFDVRSTALALAWDNRLELSYARMSLGLDALVERGLFPDRRLDTEVLGAKLRLGGDLIYGSGPQLALGLQWRRSRDPDLVTLSSAEKHQGSDVYLSASKLWVDGIASRRTLASLTLRSTNAHQLGLAGFSDRRSTTLEGSVAVFVLPDWLLGLEYRGKPDRLALAREDDWSNVFVAWLPSKQWHLALAYADLGSIGGISGQRGYYFSVQASP
ncbi:MAG: DUF3034 family protein [Lysobacterales bacterium]